VRLVLIVLVLFTLWLGTMAIAAALVVVVVRRLAALLRVRGRAGAREVTDRARLRLGAHGTGTSAEAARLRLELRDIVADTRRTVTTAAASGWPVGDAPSLLNRLERVACDLDAQLRLLALDRRPADTAQPLAEIEARVALVTGACADLRSSLRHQAVSIGDDELHRLREDCRVESEALRSRPTGLFS
jgi:hypothetical protein